MVRTAFPPQRQVPAFSVEQQIGIVGVKVRVLGTEPGTDIARTAQVRKLAIKNVDGLSVKLRRLGREVSLTGVAAATERQYRLDSAQAEGDIMVTIFLSSLNKDAILIEEGGNHG